jgi:hypothetical protein
VPAAVGLVDCAIVNRGERAVAMPFNSSGERPLAGSSQPCWSDQGGVPMPAACVVSVLHVTGSLVGMRPKSSVQVLLNAVRPSSPESNDVPVSLLPG